MADFAGISELSTCLGGFIDQAGQFTRTERVGKVAKRLLPQQTRDLLLAIELLDDFSEGALANQMFLQGHSHMTNPVRQQIVGFEGTHFNEERVLRAG